MASIRSEREIQDFLQLTGASLPIVQAPMAFASGVDLAAAVIRAGGVGSLPCAMLTPDLVREQVAAVRSGATGPLNLNFFCHKLGPMPDETGWHAALSPFYEAEGVGRPAIAPPVRAPFDEAMCAIVEEVRPEIVSFHFGLPDHGLLARVAAAVPLTIGNATTLAEAKALSGFVGAIIAQGFEAGGHAGHFLDGYRPVGTIALLRQIVTKVGKPLGVPVIAAGGLGDKDGIAAAFTAGASAVQLGTAYLHTREATISDAHRAALGDETVVTNLFTGGFARGIRNRLIDAIGPISPDAPPFPYASAALAELRRVAEADGRSDYSPFWSGQAASLLRSATAQPPHDAETMTKWLGHGALRPLEQGE